MNLPCVARVLHGTERIETRTNRNETVVFINLDSPISRPGAVPVGLVPPK